MFRLGFSALCYFFHDFLNRNPLPQFLTETKCFASIEGRHLCFLFRVFLLRKNCFPSLKDTSLIIFFGTDESFRNCGKYLRFFFGTEQTFFERIFIWLKGTPSFS